MCVCLCVCDWCEQGQARRMRVTVAAPSGGPVCSPLQLDHVSSVSLGSIYLRNRYDEPLDSYQEQDLDRYRGHTLLLHAPVLMSGVCVCV